MGTDPSRFWKNELTSWVELPAAVDLFIFVDVAVAAAVAMVVVPVVVVDVAAAVVDVTVSVEVGSCMAELRRLLLPGCGAAASAEEALGPIS